MLVENYLYSEKVDDIARDIFEFEDMLTAKYT